MLLTALVNEASSCSESHQAQTQLDLLESLHLKRGEVRLKAESDQRVSSVVSLNDPSINFDVAGSKKIIFLMISGILGLVLGSVAALLVDAQDHRIHDRRQAEQYLELPVLGAISPAEANTQGS